MAIALGLLSPIAIADEQIQVEFDIAAQALESALEDFATQSRRQVTADSSALQGLTSPAVRGVFSPRDALNRLIDDADLSVSATDDGDFQVRRIEPSTPAPTSRRGQVVTDEIVIYGTKSDLSLQDTVESVELLTAERLARDSIFNLSEAIARTPNSFLIGDNINLVSIRGVSRNGTNGAGAASAVTVFGDGVPLSAQLLTGSGPSVWDMEQVEVLRGSQSSVQGRNSIAGAIVFQSNRPTYEWDNALRVRLAEFGTRQYSGMVSGPIIDDQLAFRLAVNYDETDGYVTRDGSSEKFGFRERTTVRGRLLLEPDAMDKLSALLTVEHSDNTIVNNAPIVESDGSPDFNPADGVTFTGRSQTSDVESTRFMADVDYSFTDSISLSVLGTFDDTELSFTAAQFEPTEFGTPGQVQIIGDDVVTLEARLEFDFDRINGVIGGYYYDREAPSDNFFLTRIADVFPIPTNPIDSLIQATTRNRSEIENVAFYTGWQFTPSDKWVFDAAVRYDDEDSFAQQLDPTALVIPDSCTVTLPGFLVGSPLPVVTVPCQLVADLSIPPPTPLQSDNFGVWLPRFSVTHNINDTASVFASYRRGYRAGRTALTTEGAGPGQVFRVYAYDPEFLDSIEVGWRSEWLNRRLTFNGTLFHSEYEDQQIFVTEESGFGFILNAGQTSLQGLELSLNYEATDAWSIYGSLGVLDTNVDEFVLVEDNPATPEDETIDLAGNELENAPNLSFTVGTSYDGERGFFSASMNHKSSYWSDIFNLGKAELGPDLTEKVGASTVINTRFGYRFDRITVTGFITNAFNEEQIERAFIADSGILNGTASIDTTPSYNIRQPRTAGVIFDFSF
ncbi:MAG: TonB-dependent receptor [Pseudomonadota bacterium]